MHDMEDIQRIVQQQLTGSPFAGHKEQSEDYLPDSSGLAANQKFKSSFNVDWKVKEFLIEQFRRVHEKPLGSVITLTGSALCAQATTVQQYLLRHWPETGARFLTCLESLLESGKSRLPRSKFILCSGNFSSRYWPSHVQHFRKSRELFQDFLSKLWVIISTCCDSLDNIKSS